MSRKRSHKDVSSEVFVYYDHTELSSIPKNITSLRVDKSVKRIPANTFRGRYELAAVEYEEGLEVIGEKAFYHCNVGEQKFPSTLIEIGMDAFTGCAITQLDLSRCNITNMGGLAFSDCPHLKDIILPKTNIKRIEERTFANCESLTHLWVPSTVEYIENGAFAGCISLLSVEVPETLKSLVFIGYRIDNLVLEEYVLCGYKSLVNIYIPPTHQLDNVEEYYFMEDMKLGAVERNYELLVGKLKRRFDSLPLHRACYFQSYYSLEKNIATIQSVVTADPGASEQVDFLGMTPFHVLALAHRPCLKLFQELLLLSSLNILKCHDIFGATPFDYLCKNHSPQATCVTKSLLVNIVKPRLSFLGLDSWREDVLSGMEEVQMAEASLLRTKAKSFCKKLEKFELKELSSLLEMSVWRMKVEEESATGSEARESCRINCGSSIVLGHIMPFLESEQAIGDDDGDSDDVSDDEKDYGDYWRLGETVVEELL